MSKPLELTVYAKDPSYEPSDSFTVYLMGDGGKECAGTSCALPSRKRFTDAELAAEVWKQDVSVSAVEASGGTAIRTATKYDTFERFAKFPHYDEADQ